MYKVKTTMEGVMETGKSHYGVVLVLLAVALLILIIHPVYAGDELYLTGIVKSVDRNTGTVVVDVQSSSCHGTREFTVDEPSLLVDSVGKRIDFSIDSSICKKGEVYKMFPGGRKWR
jgi:hypothetical protein